jgi:hypothetical protein
MSGAAAEGAVRRPSQPDLRLIDWLDHQPGFSDKIVKGQTCQRAAGHVDPNGRLEPGGRGDPAAAGPLDRRGECHRVVLGEQDGQHR